MYGLNHLNSTNHLRDLFVSQTPLAAVWILTSLAAKTDGISDFVYVGKEYKISCNEIRCSISANSCKWKISQKRTRNTEVHVVLRCVFRRNQSQQFGFTRRQLQNNDDRMPKPCCQYQTTISTLCYAHDARNIRSKTMISRGRMTNDRTVPPTHEEINVLQGIDHKQNNLVKFFFKELRQELIECRGREMKVVCQVPSTSKTMATVP